MPMPTDEQIIAAGPWFQRVTFPSGLTVGAWETAGMYAKLCAGIDLRGKTALDIGCMAGVGTKWLSEQSGEEAFGCDVAESARAQFELVKGAFGASMWCYRLSAYDLQPDGGWDVVVMAGVYYHLEHPLLGLQKAWAATREVLCVEGEVSDGAGCTAEFIPGKYRGDASNWWVPTRECLLAWLEWLPGEKRIVDVTPEGWLTNRAMYQVWRGAA
jgi:tRNA (mo5U34)-methyltransferase